ncbi:MAG: hypothetical protein IJ741_10225 [Schwartzia sp.]|nr:hypothetical protein [Schwartzia sp. (in: firmicutes)]
MTQLVIYTTREGYGTDQINETMTAGELINFLEDFDEGTKIYLAFDKGYTYGGISTDCIKEEDEEDDEEQEED